MRVSAALIVSALALFTAQVLFSYTGLPTLVELPIGMVPVTAGLIALAVGFVVGLVLGTTLYRLALLVAMFGTYMFFFGLMAFTGQGEAMAWMGIAFWTVALVIGAVALVTEGKAGQHA